MDGSDGNLQISRPPRSGRGKWMFSPSLPGCLQRVCSNLCLTIGIRCHRGRRAGDRDRPRTHEISGLPLSSPSAAGLGHARWSSRVCHLSPSGLGPRRRRDEAPWRAREAQQRSRCGAVTPDGLRLTLLLSPEQLDVIVDRAAEILAQLITTPRVPGRPQRARLKVRGAARRPVRRRTHSR